MTNPQYISLSTKTDSAVIHYTVDGTPPNQGSAVYNQPIYINNNSVVGAIAYRNNFDSSDVAIR